MELKFPGLMSAAQHFFGRKPEQGLKDFAMEFRKLTEKDRIEIGAGLRAQGYVFEGN